MKMKVFVLFGLMILSVSVPAQAGSIYGKSTFYGDIVMGDWNTIASSVTGYATNHGAYLGPYTNFYRVSGTNYSGRTPFSPVFAISATGFAGGTNAVRLSWRALDGVSGYVVERAFATTNAWTNFLRVAVAYTNATDLYTNVWVQTNFTLGMIPNPTNSFSLPASATSVLSRAGSAGLNLSNEFASAAQGLLAGTALQAEVDPNALLANGTRALGGNMDVGLSRLTAIGGTVYFSVDGARYGGQAFSIWGSDLSASNVRATNGYFYGNGSQLSGLPDTNAAQAMAVLLATNLAAITSKADDATQTNSVLIQAFAADNTYSATRNAAGNSLTNLASWSLQRATSNCVVSLTDYGITSAWNVVWTVPGTTWTTIVTWPRP